MVQQPTLHVCFLRSAEAKEAKDNITREERKSSGLKEIV
jgi:hypothetical protein